MITAAKIKNGSTYLGHHLTANDYYTEKESVSGEWIGKGAQLLEIEGKRIFAGDKIFENFRVNRLPDGSKMTPRDREDRIRFVDFQCSCPKSVSVMAITMGDARLLDAHDRAATVAFREMEVFAAAQANTVFGRANRVTGNLVAARFAHTASRALDAQVHDHFVVVAATYDKEAGGWRALTEFEIFKSIRYFGKVYQNELAGECLKLGYELTPAKDSRERVTGFELAGVSEEIQKRFSKRRAQVERGIAYFKAKNGREPSPAETHVIATQTRDRKLEEVTTPEVIAAQRAQLSQEELGFLDTLKREAMVRAREGVEPPPPGMECDALRRAISHLYERDCVAQGHALLAEALNQRLGGLRLERLKAALSGPELVSVGRGEEDARRDIFVTPVELRRERWLLTVAKEDRGTMSPLASAASVSERLSEEQRRAVEGLLACTDRLASLRGAAGVGKTTVLSEVDRLLREHGREVVHCAPTASAADTLRKDGLSGAVTLASFLENAERTPMPAGAVLVVDEAGLASHREGAAVLRMAIKRDWRVVFVGDTKQHSSVEAGDFLRLLETRAGLHRVELTEIRRQTDKDYRDAIRMMSAGEAKEGLSRLDGMGCVREGGADYLQNAAQEYVAAALKAQPGKEVLCVTPTWAENHTLTHAIREELRAAGKLGEGERLRVLEPLSWTNQYKQDPAHYAAGQVVVFDKRSGYFAKGEMVTVVSTDAAGVSVRTKAGEDRLLPLTRGGFDVCATREIEVAAGDKLLLRANDKSRGLVNGTLAEVASVRDGVVRTTAGIEIDTRDFVRFSHGYVLTSHKSQGKTCDTVVVAAAHLDAKAAYVACSRGRTVCAVHTPDKVALLASLPAGNRPLVAEQPGFAAAAKCAGRAVKPVEKTPETIPAYAWFNGPWERIAGWMKGLGRSVSVDAHGKGVTRHENHHTPSL